MTSNMTIIERVITTKRFIPLRCVQKRYLETINEGDIVYGDITTLWIDEDGDTYMEMNDALGNYLGRKKLNRFRRIDDKK